MKRDFFERIFKLIKRTGDKVIITNPGSDSSFVLMTLEDYEKMVSEPAAGNLTALEPEVKIDKINEDIAIWREAEKKREEVGREATAETSNVAEEENQFYFEPVE